MYGPTILTQNVRTQRVLQTNVITERNNSSNVLFFLYDCEQQQNYDDGLNVVTIWQESRVQRFERTPLLGYLSYSDHRRSGSFSVMRKLF